MRRKDKAAGTAPQRYESTGIWPAVVTGLVLGAAAVIFVAQNTHTLALEFIWLDFRTTPGVLALATALLSVTGAVIVGAAFRWRRRHALREHAELRDLRDATVKPDEPPPAVDLSRDTPRTTPP